MTRHLLALLALLSGLAALSGPASASAHPLVACNIGPSAEASEARAHVPATPADAGDKAARRGRETQRPAPVPRPRALRMPVLMGVERALE
ncbi:hypothetical protein [Erythrobacter sp. HL-111]|uniref:hypothetical protein n=1 Tax=Erythrobacter sp. HL-111 TaxID=1798193 RepID=UPI0006D998A5|nr:hypothetical protein [Erythrobacter sp. HL-111]KPP90278.1 MAG: hypothetical protein HLUCCO15_09550 [Erythrobacteraceae bacterium HL-111]SDR85203.1 hypothetical protein SAMN04515621_0503 [Erythrobacter sp. HL-111]